MLPGLIFYLVWEAMLISYLSARTIKMPFTDLATLLRNSDYQVGILPGSSSVGTFQFSNEPDFLRAWVERIEPNMETYNKIIGFGKFEDFILL